MTRILVTGGSGELGYVLTSMAAMSHEVTATYFSRDKVGGGQAVQVDLRQANAVTNLFSQVKPEVVIHTAGSDQSSDMEHTIVTGNKHIAQACTVHNCRLIALSTDKIFDGTHPPYSEDSQPHPTTDYARAKVEAESILKELIDNLVIVRTSLIYEFNRRSRQVSWMLNAIDKNKAVTLFTDEIRHPVWSPNLSAALLELAGNSFTGELHFAGPEAMDRYTYGIKLLKAMKASYKDNVQKVKAAEIAPHRPRDLTLDLSLARQVLKTEPTSIDDAYKFQWLADQGHPISTTTRR